MQAESRNIGYHFIFSYAMHELQFFLFLKCDFIIWNPEMLSLHRIS